jgi:hypothetical protein
MRACLLAVFATGCLIPEKVGPPNCGTASCSSDEICDRTDPGGPVCISVDGDLDGDGISNGKDFCEHMPGGATDEDGDGIGDVCDPCPIAPPPSTPDPDGDAVDSPCDPDPRTPGDQILLFEGFQQGLSTDWTPDTPAAWSTTVGELVVNTTGLTTLESIHIPVTPRVNMAVEASYRIDGLVAGSTDHVVIVGGSDPRPAGVARMECGVQHDDTTNADAVAVITDQSSMQQVTNSAFDSARLYRVAGYSTSGQIGCTVIGDGNALGIVHAPITPDSLGNISLGARATSARFQWVLVVGRN